MTEHRFQRLNPPQHTAIPLSLIEDPTLNGLSKFVLTYLLRNPKALKLDRDGLISELLKHCADEREEVAANVDELIEKELISLHEEEW